MRNFLTMSPQIEFLLYAFTSYIALVNPLSTVPVFMTMTAGLDSASRRRTVFKATLTATLTMLFFALFGEVLFKIFGISVNAFKVVGGIIFFMMGHDMLNARVARMKTVSDEDETRSYVNDISITPLAIPMICGPGAITNSLILMNEAGSWDLRAVLFGVIVSINLIMMAGLLAGSQISKFMGENGTKVMLKLMGLIMMVIAVESFFAGLKPIMREILMIG